MAGNSVAKWLFVAVVLVFAFLAASSSWFAGRSGSARAPMGASQVFDARPQTAADSSSRSAPSLDGSLAAAGAPAPRHDREMNATGAPAPGRAMEMAALIAPQQAPSAPAESRPSERKMTLERRAPEPAPQAAVDKVDRGGPPDADVSGEQYKALQENAFVRVTENPLSTFGVDVDTASYANVRRFLTQGQQPPAEAVRLEELVNYFRYDYPEPVDKGLPFAVCTEAATCPWDRTHRLVRIGLRGRTVSEEALPPANLVFLLDVSGSMNDPRKLPLVKQAMQVLVERLRPVDKVAICVYAGAAGVVLPSTPGDQKPTILKAIERLSAGGSTAGGAGIALAYKTALEGAVKGGNNRVILCTDGDFNVGASSDAALVTMIEERREKGVFLTVLGVGTGNYQDAKMQQLADKGNGNYAYLDSLQEAKKVLGQQMAGTLYTIAKDVKIQIEFNPAAVQAYRLLGYEKRMLAAQDFNDDKKDAGEIGAGHTVTALYEVVPPGAAFAGASVDALKYQAAAATSTAAASGELMTVKLRYKDPDGTTSKLITQPVLDCTSKFDAASTDFRWAAVVAQFAMLLRGSAYKGDANFDQVLEFARQAQGPDLDGWRKEFVGLVERAKPLAEPAGGR